MEFSIDLIISLSLNIILFLIIIILFISINNIKKRISKFLPSDKNLDVEQMIIKYNKDILKVLEKEDEILKKIDINKIELQESINALNNILNDTKYQLKYAIQKIGLVKYNPFEEVGGNFCFAVAFLNEENTGVVINSIYTRESCYNYIKEITNGESINYKLSQEEKEAIRLAIQNNK